MKETKCWDYGFSLRNNTILNTKQIKTNRWVIIKQSFLKEKSQFFLWYRQIYSSFKSKLASLDFFSQLNKIISSMKNLAIFGRAQGDQKIRKKIAKFFKKSPKSCQFKKGQNIYNKAQFESPKHLQQPLLKP